MKTMADGNIYKSDENGRLKWIVHRHRPNPLIAVFILGVYALIIKFSFFYDRSGLYIFNMDSIFDMPVRGWILVVLIILTCMISIHEIAKRVFGDYILEVDFGENDLEIIYKRGNKKTVRYAEIGFIHFSLTQGSGFHRRFYPGLSFYYRDESVKLLDDVLYKKGFLIFKGEVFYKQDYLNLKTFFSDKGLNFYEPQETMRVFEKRRP